MAALLIGGLPLSSLALYLYWPEQAVSYAGSNGTLNLSDDSHGIYSIDGPDLQSVLEGLGYLHGRDRGATLRMLRRRYLVEARRAVKSEDPSLLVIHQALESGVAASLLERTSADDRLLIDSYVDGVRKGMRDQPGSLFWALALPGRWKATDTVNLLLYLSFALVQGASNAWVSPATEGPPILATDPHLSMGFAPGLFYATTLRFGGVNDEPVTLHAVGPAGLPFFSAAGGNHVAWAMTALTYRFIHDRLCRFHVDDEGTLHLRDEHELEISYSPGTWKSDRNLLILREQDGTMKAGRVVTSCMVELYTCPWSDPVEFDLGSILRLPEAESLTELANQITRFPGLPYLFTALDSAGARGFVSGFNPLFFQDDRPAPGDLVYIAEDQGAIWNANDYPEYLRQVLRAHGYRGVDQCHMREARLAELFGGTDRCSVESFMSWQQDIEDVYTDQKQQQFGQVLESFERSPVRFDHHNTHGAAYESSAKQQMQIGNSATMERISELREQYESGSDDGTIARLVANMGHAYEPVYRLESGGSWDTGDTPPVPDLDTEIKMREQFLYLLDRDRLYQDGPAFALVSPARFLLSPEATIRPFALPLGGPNSLQLFTDYASGEHEFVSSVFRLVVVLGGDPQAYIAIPPGQSERPVSAHYGDFVDLWADGGYHRIGE
jgi:hypothetical protein